MNPLQFIYTRQRFWALRHGIPFDNQTYVAELNDNLFLPLSPGAIQDFQGGAGGELEGNMYALHSSSALVVNVFDYWRLYDHIGPIFSTICPHLAHHAVEGLNFEVPVPINWPVPPQGGAIPPHLDVVIRYRDQADPDTRKIVAIESKFREPYGQNQGTFQDIYLDPANAPLWQGLAPLHDLATQIHAGQVLYHRLKVAQLIKHILGLKSQFEVRNFGLLYLWYAVPGPAAVQHAQEIRGFRQLALACTPPVNFRALTYQELIHALAGTQRETHGAYVDYLLERYF